MRISCPDCGYARDVAENRIPAGNPRVSCPRCPATFVLVRRPESTTENTDPTVADHSGLGSERRAGGGPPTDYAGFWIRFLAWSVDALLLGLVNLTFSLASGLISGQGVYFMERTEQLTVAMATAPLSFLFATVFGYSYLVFFIGYCGQTPGKMAVRVKVIRADRTEVGFGRAFLREVVGKFCSKLIFGVGYLMVAFDSRKQGLHDKIADTCVIKLQ